MLRLSSIACAAALTVPTYDGLGSGVASLQLLVVGMTPFSPKHRPRQNR